MMRFKKMQWASLPKALRVLFKVAAVLFVIGAISPVAFSQSFVEGKHYTVLDNSILLNSEVRTNPGDVSVVEYFSFSCPGCYAVEPSITALEANEPRLNLRRVHLPYGGQKAKYSQKVYVLLQLLDANRHKDAVFSRIHVQRNFFDSDREITDFFNDLGYDSAVVNETLASFAADVMLRRMNKDAVQNKIQRVPTIIVNGKYKVNVGELQHSQTLSQLVSYLRALP